VRFVAVSELRFQHGAPAGGVERAVARSFKGVMIAALRRAFSQV